MFGQPYEWRLIRNNIGQWKSVINQGMSIKFYIIIFKPLSEDKIFDESKLKQIADDISKGI